MSLQDSTFVRTAAELEKKYNLNKLSHNVETSSNEIIRVQNELNNFAIITSESLENMETEIDGKVTTWYYPGVPSLINSPANEWDTDEKKDKHIGDLYYDQSTGYCYRFQKSSNTYSWQLLRDSKVTEALSAANAAQDTADGKRRIFVAQPYTPYDNGDLWVQGSNGDIKVCQLSRAEGSYNANDWIIASKYTDNTVANAIVDELGGTTTTVLHGQVVQITDTFAKYTDLATGGSTTIAGENITTGNIKSANYVQGTSGTNINLTDGKISTKNVNIDDEGLKLSNGAKVVGSNGLKNTYLYEAEGVLGYGRDWEWNEATQDFDHIQSEPLWIDFYIPSGLNVTKAKIHIVHTPVYWSWQNESDIQQHGWGKSRNVKLAKASNIYSREILAVLSSSIYHNGDGTTYDTTSAAVVNAFGSSGWTPPTNNSEPSSSNHPTDSTISADVKDAIVTGLNTFKIYCPDAVQTWSDSDIAYRTGWAHILLEIEGYMTYS